MASYKSGFDPPIRPGETARSRRLGYVPSRQAKAEHGETDISSQAEPRRGHMNKQSQTGFPRPHLREPSPARASVSRSSIRDPSPNTRLRPEPPVKASTSSRFGFGRSTPRTEVPELRTKSSRNVLRRKPSSIAQNAENFQGRSVSSSPTKWDTSSAEERPSIDASLRAEAYNDIFTRSRAIAASKDAPRIIPELDRYRSVPDQSSRPGTGIPHKLSTQDLPPPTPLLSGTSVYSGNSSYHRYSGHSGSGYSGSPSTRFSESPGPGGAYSRDTTPTSMSSMSPGIIAPHKTPPRIRQGSPAINRPPITLRGRSGSNANETEAAIVDPQGLPSLRESLTSSSSNSTVKGDGKKEKKRKKRMSPLPPSPPPRKSSQKFKKLTSEGQESPSKPSLVPAKSIMNLQAESPTVKPILSPPDPSTKARIASPSESSPLKARPTMHTRQNSNPPTRPSREGTPDLQSQLGDMATIIQSNLSGLGFSQGRRRSVLPRSAASSPLQNQLPSPALRRPSLTESSALVMPSQREATPAPSGLGIIPDLRPAKTAASTGARTPSPSVANSRPRFGLFGRRTKTAPELPTVETKPLRKGPAAGTGHEGYGRYAVRGRSNSATSLTRGRDRSISAASSSQESVASTRTHDPFLRDRMSPVIIAGGGDIVENRNASSELSRSESNTSLSLAPSMHSRASSSKSGLGNEAGRTTLWPSALPRDASKRQSSIVIPKGRRPSDSSDDEVGKSSLAFRRSIQRFNHSASDLNLPPPLNISKVSMPGSSTTLDASIMSDESQTDGHGGVPRGRKGVIAKPPKKLEKRPKSPRKWNIFHRSQSAAKVREPMQVTVGKAPAKSVPHYAMLDSSDEQLGPLEMPDLEDILRDAEVVDLSNEELDILQ